MTPVRLKRLLKKDTGTLIQRLTATPEYENIAIQDVKGAWLIGQEPHPEAVQSRSQ